MSNSQKLLEGLAKFEKKLMEMTNAEFVDLFENTKVTEEQASQYATLEKMLRGETVGGWRLAGKDDEDSRRNGDE